MVRSPSGIPGAIVSFRITTRLARIGFVLHPYVFEADEFEDFF